MNARTVAPRGEKTLWGTMIGGMAIGGQMIGGQTIEGQTIEGQTIEGQTIEGQTIEGWMIGRPTTGGLTTGGLMIEEFPPPESLQAREQGAQTDQNDLTSLKKEHRLVAIYIA
jgi:hypothetical protein